MIPGPTGARALAQRLSGGLALLTLGGLALVALAVYFFSAQDLADRQDETLAQKRAVVAHLLRESAPHNGTEELTHKLNDFFVGQDDLRLTLTNESGVTFFDNTQATGRTSNEREARFTAVGGTGRGSVTAHLVLNTSRDASFLRQLALTLAIAALVGAMVISFAGQALVRWGLAPLRGLVDQAGAIGADNLHQRLDGSNQPAELQPLIRQFNDLLRRLNRAYELMESFNANVAHELRTPLATLMTSTELVLRRPHPPEAQREVLESNLEELQRLASIVNDMLFLSHADRGEVAPGVPVPSLAELASEVAEFHEAAVAEAGITIAVNGDVPAICNVGLVKRAVSNLLDNGTRYAVAGSTLAVNLAPADEGRKVSISVTNQGRPIAQSHQARLFDRFYRVEGDGVDSAKRHGLGLAIVAAIARMHHGEPFVGCTDSSTTIGFTLQVGEPAAAPQSH